MANILKVFKESLPQYIHTLPEKNKPAVWLPQEYALQYERFRTFGNDRRFLMLDYDHKGGKAKDHRQYDIEPNIVIYNPHNQNHQAYWLLGDPVHCQESSKYNKPYQFLRAIESAYDEKYDGDQHFARYISRNPFYAFVDTDWRHDRPHKLNALAEVVQLNKRRIKKGDREVTGRGRNNTVFDDLRRWAYKQDTSNITYNMWLQRCITKAIDYNMFDKPMELPEVQSIGKSVAQYTYNRTFNETFAEYVQRTHTSEIQAKRGAIGGKKSKRKPVAGSEASTKPWESMGISRATYYRRKAKE
jgi:Primase C terminal 1 (PriCT-1)./Replicase family.